MIIKQYGTLQDLKEAVAKYTELGLDFAVNARDLVITIYSNDQ